MSRWVLGISGYYHDSAACLVEDGQLRVAMQEERATRIKHDASFPERAIASCLEFAGKRIGDVELVAYYELPHVHAERVIQSQIRFAPRGWRAFPRMVRSLIGGKLWVEHEIGTRLGYEGPVLCVPHHMAHAASAFLPSPYDRAAILTVDGVGEWATSSLGKGEGARVELLEEQRFPHSLGLFYATMTAWCGFKVNSGEYKLMGLSPYGVPRYVDALREVIAVREDGTVRLNLRYFDFPAGLSMGRARLGEILDGPARVPESPLTQREADIAKSTQVVLETALLSMARHARARTGYDSLCLAGGVALNCVAVQKILEAGIMREVFVQPAAGDAGGALGAALLGAQEGDPEARPTRDRALDAMGGCLLGPSSSEQEIRRAIAETKLVARECTNEELDERVVAMLVKGDVVGWYQGRMEFGPRALGARSILADPRGHDTRDRVNRDVKRREAFRPFAPAVLEEHMESCFRLEQPAPYMTRTVHAVGFRARDSEMKKSSDALVPQEVHAPLPAVTHVDGTSRVQTVDAGRNPRFHALLQAFYKATGVPVLLNTSFNLRGEPLVHTPMDAIRTFAHTGLRALALGQYLIVRDEQPAGVLEAVDAPITHAD